MERVAGFREMKPVMDWKKVGWDSVKGRGPGFARVGRDLQKEHVEAGVRQRRRGL